MIDLTMPWWHIPMFLVLFYIFGFYALGGLAGLWFLLPRKFPQMLPAWTLIIAFLVTGFSLPFIFPPWYVYHKWIKKDVKKRNLAKALTVDWESIGQSKINILKDDN